MKITDVVSITELSRLLNKSRPTVYKYVSDFEAGKHSEVPLSVRKLFHEIQGGNAPKKEIYEYCDRWFMSGSMQDVKKPKDKPITIQEIVKLIKLNQKKLDLKKLKEYLVKEIEKND